MATFRKIIAMVDDKKPNAFKEEQKFMWLSELDGNIAADIFLIDIGDIRQLQYSYPEDMDRDLLVGYPHEGIYEAWLSAMIDQENGEYEKYQNAMQIYNSRLSRFARWFGRTYEPAQGQWVQRGDVPTYYLTAYGLAKSMGFTGTLEEWLVSLIGPKGDAGRSVRNAEIDSDGELVIEFDDGVKTYPGGVTAYALAREQGFAGTLAEWLLSLVGPKGDAGYSPSVSVTRKENGVEFQAVNEDGQTTAFLPDGLSIDDAWVDANGQLMLHFNDGQTITAGYVVGPVGPQGEQGAVGEAGNGINSAELNADYTLTITFDDGTKHTTPSIRGEAGPQGKTGETGPQGEKGASIHYTDKIEAEADASITATADMQAGDLVIAHTGALFQVKSITYGQANLTYLTTVGGNDGASIHVAAEVGQMIVVKEVGADGKPTAWEAVDRTHWKEVKEGRLVLDSTTVSFQSEYGSISVGSDGITEGEKYTVTWNGTEYACTAFMYNGGLTLGNASLYGIDGGEDTGEPFVFEVISSDSSSLMKNSATAEDVMVKIEVPSVVTIQKLPGEFLPDGVPYSEDGIVEIMPETTVTYDESGDMITNPNTIVVLNHPAIGGAYTVNWKGVPYECVGQSFEMDGMFIGVALGNLVFAGGSDTGEPFVLMFVDPSMVAAMGAQCMIGALDGSTESVVSVFGVGETIHKLDNKYLDWDWLPTIELGDEIVPETIVTNGDVSFSEYASRFDGVGTSTHDWYDGKKFVVRMDGKEYTTSVFILGTGGDALIGAGNLSLNNQEYPNTGEPFTIAFYYDYAIFYWYDNAETHTVAIYDLEHNKLPEEFLPESVVTRTEFEAALGAYITDVATLVGGDA